MNVTRTIKIKVLNVPHIKALMTKTQAGILTIDRTPPPTEITCTRDEYTDEQFHADLKKASKQLDAMERKALKEYKEGKTREFPV